MAHQWIKYIIAGVASLLICACKHEPIVQGYRNSNYPPEIEKIIVNKCAVSGCHNDLSYEAAAGLNMTTWNDLFKGASSGSVIIPYRPDYSPLCFFTNTDTSLGIALQPTMPVDQEPLSKDEYLRIVSWITDGASSATGEVMFANTVSTGKFYVTNRMCDVVTVFDAGSLLQTNYVDAGIKPEKEFPYCVKVSPDKRHWYVSFFAPSTVVQKFSTADDKMVSNLNLGYGLWQTFAITSDSKYGYFADHSAQGRIIYADLVSGTALAEYTFGGKFKYLSGIVLNEPLKKMYVGTLTGNFIYSIDITDSLEPVITEVPIDGSSMVKGDALIGPVELLTAPGNNKCFIACQQSGDIRVMDMQTDKLLHTIALGASPAFMAYSREKEQLFVSCPDDETSFPGNRGAVVVIDVITNSVITKIKSGYQPYGIAVDELRKRVIVVNANISSAGPASHHASRCGEKNGNVTFIDLETLKIVPGKKREVAVFPFGVALQ